MSALTLCTGYEVRAFDPRTLGVVKYGRVLAVGRKFARVDFGVTGAVRVPLRDILEVTDTRPPAPSAAIDTGELRAALAAGADIGGGSAILAARVMAAAAHV